MYRMLEYFACTPQEYYLKQKNRVCLCISSSAQFDHASFIFCWTKHILSTYCEMKAK